MGEPATVPRLQVALEQLRSRNSTLRNRDRRRRSQIHRIELRLAAIRAHLRDAQAVVLAAHQLLDLHTSDPGNGSVAWEELGRSLNEYESRRPRRAGTVALERIEQLERIVDDVQRGDFPVRDCDGVAKCGACFTVIPDDTREWDKTGWHQPWCVWRRARELRATS